MGCGPCAVQVSVLSDDESGGASTSYMGQAGQYTTERLHALRLDQGPGGAAGSGGGGDARTAATFIPDANQIHEARKKRVCCEPDS